MQDIGMQYHIHCKEGDVGRYCFLPGDPGRCEAIAQHFDNPVHIGMNREYNIYTGYLLGENADAAQVCAAIQQFFALEPAARQEMSDRAYRLWETQYDAQRNAEAFIAEIQELLQ